MPWGSVVLQPGIDVERTPTLNMAGYTEANYGRFRAGLFEKLGGWQYFYTGVFTGTPRALHAWQDLNSVDRLAIATTAAVTAVKDSTLNTITPQTLDSDFTPDFSTTAASASVEITDPNISGLTTDVVVNFRTPITVDGIILSGTYPIATITGADSYTIVAATDAVAGVSNAGAVPAFTTTSGSSSVTVTLAAHGQSVGNIVVFPIVTTVGGVTLSGKYSVTAVSSVDAFTVTASTTATSSAGPTSMNSGDAGLTYFIALGPPAAGVGYGVGGYGSGAYGLGTSSAGVQTGTPLAAADWTLDNWGEILLGCPQNGGIYYWQPGTGYQNLAIIPNAPFFNTGMFVSMAQQQVIAYGSAIDARLSGGIGIYQDPLLVQWSDIGDFFTWGPTPDNFARNRRLSTGSKIVGAGATQNRNLVWTDLDVHAMSFNGSDSVYSFNRVAGNCGLIGKHAWAEQNAVTYWLGLGNPYAYGGSGVAPIPCSVWDFIFQDLDKDNAHKCVVGSDTDSNEIWFLFPSASGGTGENDSYAKFNTTEGAWDKGRLKRSAWIDRSVLGAPIGASPSGSVYSHETGYDDVNSALTPYFETGYFYLDEGREFVFIDELYPDFKWGVQGGSDNAQVSVTLLVVDNSGDTPREFGPFVVSKATPSVRPYMLDINGNPVRIRGRMAALRVRSNDVGTFWRLGKIRFRYAPDGRR